MNKITEESLAKRPYHRIQNKTANIEKPKKDRTVQKKWEKRNQKQFMFTLDTRHEARIIEYLDSLPQVKPYINNLIIDDMNNHTLKKVKSSDRLYETCKAENRREVNLKYNRNKEQDVINFLQSQKCLKAYIVSLIEQDMDKNGYQSSNELIEYENKNKVLKKSIKRKLYAAMYCYLEEKINKNSNAEINYTDLHQHCLDSFGGHLSDKTYCSYKKTLFNDKNIFIPVDFHTFKVNTEEFAKLPKPIID